MVGSRTISTSACRARAAAASLGRSSRTCPPSPRNTGTMRTRLAPFEASNATASSSVGFMRSRYASSTRKCPQSCLLMFSKGFDQPGSREPCAKRTMPSFNAAASVQSLAAALVDSLQQAQGAEADGAVRERMAEVLDDVERDRHVQAGQDTR